MNTYNAHQICIKLIIISFLKRRKIDGVQDFCEKNTCKSLQYLKQQFF